MGLDEALRSGLIVAYDQKRVGKYYVVRLCIRSKFVQERQYYFDYLADTQIPILGFPLLEEHEYVGKSIKSYRQASENVWRRISANVMNELDKYNRVKSKYEAKII